jgi:hypothetical protein
MPSQLSSPAFRPRAEASLLGKAFRPVLLALGRFGVRARLHFPSCAALPAWPPLDVPPSVPVFPRTKPSSDDVAEPGIRAKVPLFPSPNEAFRAPMTRRGTCRPAVDPSHLRRGLAAPPSLLGPASNTWCAAPKTQGGFVAHTEPQVAEAIVNPPDVVRPTYPVFATRPAPRSTPRRISQDPLRSTTRILPRVRIHHCAPQKIPVGFFAPHHTNSHVGNSWLIAACMVATSAPRVGLQPSSS